MALTFSQAVKAIDTLRARLAKLPLPAIPVAQLGGLGINLPERRLFHTRAQLTAALTQCAPGVLGTQDILVRQACFLSTVQNFATEINGVLLSLQALKTALEQSIIPGIDVRDPATARLRAGIIDYGATLDAWIAALRTALSGPSGWTATLANTTSLLGQNRALLEAIQTATGITEADRTEALARFDAMNLDTLGKIYVPMVDLGLRQVELARQSQALANQMIAGSFKLLRDNIIGFGAALDGWKRALGDMNSSQGILGSILEGLFGKDPGKKILTAVLVVGVGALVIAGGIYGVRYALGRAVAPIPRARAIEDEAGKSHRRRTA